MDSQNYNDEAELKSYAVELEARIGRQAMLLEQTQLDLAQAHANYTKLISVAAQIKSGEISLDRFFILSDGLSWQVAALVTAEVGNDSPMISQEPDETCPSVAVPN